MSARRLRIHGRVQGVCYRATTRDQARGLGLSGWVRNRHDGTVELWAEGPDAALDALEAWCHDGPPAARVTQVERGVEVLGAEDPQGSADFPITATC